MCEIRTLLLMNLKMCFYNIHQNSDSKILLCFHYLCRQKDEQFVVSSLLSNGQGRELTDIYLLNGNVSHSLSDTN